MHASTYRPEIDGLRALAVMPVILFHLSPSFLPNGFLGVDVFFVISGYLISGILLKALSAGDFSLLAFWGRRLRRLFPALSTVLIVSLLAGWLVLFGPEWKSLSWQCLATLTSTANLFYWRAAGDYWGPTAESMPLLHMWSLAIEEQFYFIYPLVLAVATRRLSLRALQVFLLLIAICSFMLMVAGMMKFRAAAFYLLPCRMWELLVGGWLASLAPAKRSRSALNYSVFGVLLLVATYLMPIRHGEFSVAGCLSAVTATGLVLRYGETNAIIAKCLTCSPILWIGRMSYSLYLWHWPVIVLGSLFLKMNAVGAACVITGLSWFSWAFIEQRTRYLPTRRFSQLFTVLLAALIVSSILPFYVRRPTIRFSPPAYNAAANIQPPYTANVDGWLGTWDTGLTIGNLDSPNVRSMVLLGDSHGVMYFLPVKQAADAVEMTLTSFAADGGTSPFFVPDDGRIADYGPNWDPDDRRRFDVVRREFIAKWRPRLAVVTGRWSHYLTLHGPKELERHFKDLMAAFPPETRFIVIGQPPELPFGSGGFQDGELSIPPLRAFFEEGESRNRRMTAHGIIKRIAAKNPKLTFVDVQSIFQTTVGIRFLEGPVIYYKDDDHLSIAGAALCSDIIQETVSEAASIEKGSL